ncbi:uncharacterized protein LOC119685316 isoform X1 [Teleopsis dalmanni]|uniref:uncharacterized protein LOC119685316 isoform X1 n=1 Tax=Teleopsis dalmanni TaxID=139649 RepID=UPI0018CEB61C|nr:uncharacterized protein LOC119685316 isoform X1 [Teleopsis dalmanni]
MRNPAVVRQKTRKSVEELYGTKYEIPPAKANVNVVQKTARIDREHGYIMNNSPYNACNKLSGAPPVPNSSVIGTTRRRTGRPQPITNEKPSYQQKDDMPDNKRDSFVKQRTGRMEKSYANQVYDKNYENEKKKEQHHVHHNHHHNNNANYDEDKDDDTEEFFELIRQTVESAIAVNNKSITDVFNRNFRDLSAKIDRFSTELKATNAALNKMQNDMNNKVIHYGEENSRHFRYLCMKSEYDKMFYQHHAMMTQNLKPEKGGGAVGGGGVAVGGGGVGGGGGGGNMSCNKSNVTNETDLKLKTCPCRSNRTLQAEPHKSSSEDQIIGNISNKSSEMGMREVLEHIQRFCNQMQMGDMKTDDVTKNNVLFHMENAMKLVKPPMFEEDDDEDEDFQISSDGMTPRSDDQSNKFSNNTMHLCTTRGATGGGDA